MDNFLSKDYKAPKKPPRFSSYSAIIEEIKAGERVLDVGCSEGYLASYLPNNQTWGIDGNPNAVEVAKTTCVSAVTANLNEEPESKVFLEEFDVIVFADVLEHLLFPERILNHFSGYLKPGGKVIISLPNVALWSVRLRLLFGMFNYSEYGVLDKTHLHLYTYKTANELVASAGFSVIKEKWAHQLLGFIIYAFPILRKLFSIHVIVVAKKR